LTVEAMGADDIGGESWLDDLDELVSSSGGKVADLTVYRINGKPVAFVSIRFAE